MRDGFPLAQAWYTVNPAPMQADNSERAYRYIKQRILSGEYSPGRSLTTHGLSAEIGVSRTPVRDALRQLENDGLVTILSGVGARVTSMSVKEFKEMCEMRLALESHAAAMAATNATDADLQEIGSALAAMRDLTPRVAAAPSEEPLLSDLRQEDVRFHVAIMSAAKSELLKKEILRLHVIRRVVGSAGPQDATPKLSKREIDAHRKTVLGEHEKIFAAIKKRNARSAREAMIEHIQGIIDHSVAEMQAAVGEGRGNRLSEDEMSYVP
jgi:DNA-binding GntR family transcriptional regulator